MIRLLAFAVVCATPVAALADTPIQSPNPQQAQAQAQAQRVAVQLREAAPSASVGVVRIAPPRAARPKSIKIRRHIDWTLASDPIEMELRPARDFNALEDGFRIQGKKIGFFRSF